MFVELDGAGWVPDGLTLRQKPALVRLEMLRHGAHLDAPKKAFRALRKVITKVASG